jgi:hypothetical protein
MFKTDVEKMHDRYWNKLKNEKEFISLKREIERTIIYLQLKLETINERIAMFRMENT